MVIPKNVISQVQDLQVLLHDIHAEGMTLSETFQVAAIIEKLPPSWVEFKNYLKHKRKEMSVEDLVVRLHIEEDNKLAQKDTYAPESAKANMVEHAGSSSRSNPKGKGKDKRKNDKKSKGKSEYLAPKAGCEEKFQGLEFFILWGVAGELTSGDKTKAVYGQLLATADIRVVRSDRGGEYVAPFTELCAKHGIRHEFTAPYSPQQTSIAERKNRTLKEMIPRKEKEETPYELWMGRKPSYQYLRVWGCLAKVAVPTPKAQKIGPKSVDCIFIGYVKKSTAYRFIIHESKNPDI
ncbi:retrovirus-related pol polyprotein from transposon TNT 1-94 [Tanacetum coccineum]